MNIRRGDIVIVEFPYSDLVRGKVRPALVVQSDIWNQRLNTTMLVGITSSQNRRVGASTQFFIDIATTTGQQTGLRLDSVVQCEKIMTINQTRILRVIGSLPHTVMQEINGCLKAALGIS